MANSKSKNPVSQIADAIEAVRRDKGEVDQLDLIALGFTIHQLDAHGLDARALHAQRHKRAVAL